MKGLPYFKWYPGDAETDEFYTSLTDAERSFYHRCLNRSWINSGLPLDLNELAAAMAVTRKYLDKVWPKVSQKFRPNGCVHPRLVNSRQEEERSDAINKGEKNKRPGNANASREKRERVSNAFEKNATESGERVPNASQQVRARADSDSDSEKEKKEAYDPMPGWTTFKLGYPAHRINEWTDLQLWIAVVESTSLETRVLSGLKAHKSTDDWTKERGKYVPQAKKFLSERIFDVPVESKNGTSGPDSMDGYNRL